MAKTYLVEVSVYIPYPKTFSYRPVASGLSTAVGRALKMFRKDVKGKKIKSVNIKATTI